MSEQDFRLPARAPRLRSRLMRALGRAVLRVGGWQVRGEWPDVDRCLVIAAPHSSGWDAVWGLAAKMAFGIDIKLLAKAELFRGASGLLIGPLLRAFGAIPVDRHAAHGVVGEIVEQFRQHDNFWLVLAPEGTRRRVEHWRSGFWHIARQAQVPLFCAYFHYPEKIIGLGRCIELSDDAAADMVRIREYYRPFIGKHRGTV